MSPDLLTYTLGIALISAGFTGEGGDMTTLHLLAMGAGVAVLICARLLAENRKHKEWAELFNKDYSPHIRSLRDLLGEPYGRYTDADDGWSRLKHDAEETPDAVREWMVQLDAERPDLEQHLSDIAHAYGEFDRHLRNISWRYTFKKWLRRRWEESFDHDEILRIWAIGECVRAQGALPFSDQRKLIKSRGGFSPKFMKAASGDSSTEGVEYDG